MMGHDNPYEAYRVNMDAKEVRTMSSVSRDWDGHRRYLNVNTGVSDHMQLWGHSFF